MPAHIHNTNLQTRHNRATRLMHASSGLAIVTQLLTSLQMHGPNDVQAAIPPVPGSPILGSGYRLIVLALGFWVTVLQRSRGTELAR